MAELARCLGFDSPEIEGLINSSPDHQIARSALLQAQRPDRYRILYEGDQFDILINQIVSCFTHAVPDQPDRSQELLADSTMKPRIRSGVPQTRTQKQDNALLFLGCLHAEVEIARTITTFFVRRSVYFAFFGKPTPHGRIPDGDQPMGDVPPSRLFVEEEEPSDSHEQTAPTAPSSGPTHDRQEESQGDGAGLSEARPSIARQQPSRRRNTQEHLKHRRRKVRMCGLGSRPATEREEEQEKPMEWELLNMETQDHEISDQSSPHNEDLSLLESTIEPVPVDSAPSAMYDTHGSTGVGDADAASDCTRISIETNEPAQDPDEG
jgi:hypothetical protein